MISEMTTTLCLMAPEELKKQLSYCAAEWLDAHPYFNTPQPFAKFDDLSKDLREPEIKLGLIFLCISTQHYPSPI